MRKYRFLAVAVIFVCVSFSLFGQSSYDRNQLSLFFQNQEFEKAINYLQENPPLLTISNIMQTWDMLFL